MQNGIKDLITKGKTFEMKPLMEIEAICQMNLLNLQFFMFYNAEIENKSFIYQVPIRLINIEIFKPKKIQIGDSNVFTQTQDIDNALLKFDKDNLSLNHLQSVFNKVSIKIDFLTSRTNGKYNLADYYEFAGEIPLIVNGKKVEWLTEHIIKDSIAMLPIRSVAEALNAKVVWDDKSQTATISKDNTTIIVPLNKDVVSVNGSQYKIPNNSILKDNRTLSTISFIVENLNASMVWDAQINSLVINSK